MAEAIKVAAWIPAARARFWDYGWNAAYFVTICTQNRACWFGDVVDDEMGLSDIGIIADQCWVDIPNHFPFVKLGVHVVMPNHVHGIVIIDKPSAVETQNIASFENTIGMKNTVETQNFASLPPPPKNKFGPQSQNLASIIRGFKIGVTTNARLINIDFTWQSRYHDHIIRDEMEYERISQYIIKNPANWGKDKFYQQ